MAVKLEKTKTMSGDSRYSIKLVVQETGTSGNSSTISYTLTATKSSGSGYYTSNSNNQVKITIDGTDVVNKKISYDFTGSTPKTITLASGTRTITHNEDGTKTIACSGYFKDSDNSLGSATASGSLILTALHTPPTPRIDSITETNSNLLNYGITNLNTTFVAYLSKKQFAVSSRLATPDDYITSYTIKNGNLSSTSSTSPIELDFKNQPITFGQPGYVQIDLSATDEMNSTGTISVLYSNYILYTPATIVESSFKSQTKRAGQLTGNITLSANGTYYNGSIGSGQTAVAVSPIVSYRYKEKTAQSYNNWIDIADASINKNNGNWSTSITLSGFNYQKAYDIEVKVSDNVAEANSLNVATASTTIPVGEPTWTEYKDRVDFKRITRQKGEVYGEFVLYNDATGTTEDITLTDDSFANYDYIEIFYYDASNNGKRSEKVYSPNNSTITLNMIYDNGTYCYLYAKSYSISGTTMTAGAEIRWRIATSGNATRGTTTTNTTIYRVVGYK